ncbi:type II secretion system protein [bacterium]|nr:type II secretion system protein [bacterium]NCQ55737.1 type II secretion system protein [Candidatus Parcubacteria bacterium]NCS67686.1 type II secretion system protein [Candidatus Peregrinibacteria bacterium]NCS96700.1 type II secretion system protein [bacterium]
MQTLKQKGFTLIELLVVIVIIGILATISVATFSGYFAKARDSERQAVVRNVSTLLKTARAVESIPHFGETGLTTGTAIDVSDTLNTEGGYSIPDDTTDAYKYGYMFLTADGEQFAFAVCSEETQANYFIDGTTAAIQAVATANGTTAICSSTDHDLTDATVANYTILGSADL